MLEHADSLRTHVEVADAECLRALPNGGNHHIAVLEERGIRRFVELIMNLVHQVDEHMVGDDLTVEMLHEQPKPTAQPVPAAGFAAHIASVGQRPEDLIARSEIDPERTRKFLCRESLLGLRNGFKR